MQPAIDDPKPTARLLSDLAEEFFKKQHFAPKTTRDYKKYVAEFIAFVHNGDVSALTLDAAIRWRYLLLKRGKHGHVARLATETLRTFARWLAASGHVRDSNTGGSVLLGLERTKTTFRERQALRDEELDAVWIALAERPNRDRTRGLAYMRLIYATGWRGADVRRILRRNFDPTSRWIKVSVPRKAGTSVRRLRLDRTTAVAIEDYLNDPERRPFLGKDAEPLFIQEDGIAFAEGGFASWVGRVSRDVRNLLGIPFNSGSVSFTSQEHAKSKIQDADLRRRCWGLLQEDSDHDRAIEVATQELETRVREKSAAGRLDGDDLMKHAFLPERQGQPPRLVIAEDPQEQAGAFSLYRGVANLYRNGTHHDARADDFDPDEARRIVALVDHLLGLID